MRQITEKQFDKMRCLSSNLPSIRFYDKNHLIKKISKIQAAYILKNVGKKVENAILAEEVLKFTSEEKYAYIQEYAKGYSDLSAFYWYQREFDDKEILKFYKSLLETERLLHKSGVFSGDMWYKNILLNAKLNYQFIDFELRIDPLFLKYYGENLLTADFLSDKRLIISDKMSLLTMILNSIQYGEFLESRVLYPCCYLEECDFPKPIEKKFVELMQCKEPPQEDDYFLEEFDELIDKQYQLPFRKREK